MTEESLKDALDTGFSPPSLLDSLDDWCCTPDDKQGGNNLVGDGEDAHRRPLNSDA